MRIAITGGAGFVGGHLTRQLRAAGHEVAVFTRGSPARNLAGFDALIHAAWDFADPNGSVAHAVQVLEYARAGRVPRLIFISSLSAFEGCRSRYGKAKLAVEQIVTAFSGINVRLGLVYDETNRGLSGALKRLAALPVVPLPGAGDQILHLINADDLGPVFLDLIENFRRTTVNLADPEPVTMAGLMRRFARAQNKRPIFIPIPWRLLWIPLRLFEAGGFKLKFRSDSLVSLMNQNPPP